MSVWFYDAGGTFSGGANADQSNPIIGTTPDATFTYSGPLQWYNGNGEGSNNAVNLFLNPADISGFSSPASTFASVSAFGNAQMSQQNDNCANCTSFWQVTGTSYFGASTTVTHDDGASVYLDGNFSSPALFAPTPVYVETSSFSATPGDHSFVIDYVEANGAPSALEVSTAVPELSTWAMMALGFVGLGFAGYRGSRKASATVTL